MNRAPVVATLAIIALFSSASAGYSQEADPPSLSGIPGGYDWGMTQNALVSLRGQPSKSMRGVRDVVIVTYIEPSLGSGATVTYHFAPGLGLVKGDYRIPFATPDDCKSRYRMAVVEFGPLFSKEETLNFCRLKRSLPMAQWIDPSTGNLIGVMAEYQSGRATVVYEAKSYSDFITGKRR